MIKEHFRLYSLFQSLRDPSLLASSYIIAHRFRIPFSQQPAKARSRIPSFCASSVIIWSPAILLPSLPFKTQRLEPRSWPVALAASPLSFCPYSGFSFSNTGILSLPLRPFTFSLTQSVKYIGLSDCQLLPVIWQRQPPQSARLFFPEKKATSVLSSACPLCIRKTTMENL